MWVIGKYYAILYKGLKNLLVFVSSNQLVLEPIPYGQRGENESMNCSLTRCLSQWDFPGKNTRVGCHFLLQEIVRTQGLNLGLLHCQSVQSLSRVRLFATHESQHARPPCPSPTAKPMSIELVMPSNHLILCCPLRRCFTV